MTHRMLANVCAMGLAGAALICTSGVEAANCSKLSKLELPHTSITGAEDVAAGAFKPPAGPPTSGPAASYSNLPAFCRVAGTIKPTADSDRGIATQPIVEYRMFSLQIQGSCALQQSIFHAPAGPASRRHSMQPVTSP